jgi:PAS domain-containing protein
MARGASPTSSAGRGRCSPAAGGPGSLLLGTRLWDAFPASLGGPFEAAWRRAMRERLPQSVTGYHAALGLWVTADAFPAGGGLTIFFRDVSAAKLAEAALRDSEARLKAVLEHVPVGVLLAEAPSGRLLLGNRQAEEILGRPVRFGAGVAGAAPDAAALGEAAGGAEAFPLARTLATGAHAQGELRMRRGDGGLVWIRAWSAPIRDATGRVTGAVAAFADIGAERESATALQRQVAAEAAARQAAIAAAEALAESEERFRRFGEASPDGLWIGDPTGRRLDYANPAFERLWGRPRRRSWPIRACGSPGCTPTTAPARRRPSRRPPSARRWTPSTACCGAASATAAMARRCAGSATSCSRFATRPGASPASAACCAT